MRPPWRIDAQRATDMVVNSRWPVVARGAGPLFLLLVLFALDAQAAIDSAGVFDSALDRYSTAASSWAGVITAAASWLFWTLVAISMVWTFGMMAMRKADIGEFFAELVRFTIFTGFFWWLLTNGPKFASSIYASLRQVAGNATGLGNALSPSGIVDIGFAIFDKVLDQSTVWAPVDSFAGITLAVGILVMLALVGVNMLLLLVSGWVLAYGGVFFLGFGGSRWTSDMAINYYKTVLAVAAQLMTMVLLVGIGKTFLDDYYSRMSAGISLKEMGVLFVVVLILLALVNKLPQLISGVVTGSSIGHSGIGQLGAGAAVGAAGMAAGAVAASGAMLAAGASSAAGGAQAIMAAVSKAGENVQSGSDVLAGLWDSGGPGGGGGGNPYGDDYSTGNTPFAQAAGFARNAGGSSSPTDKGSKAAGGGSTKQATGGESKQGGSGSGRVGSAVRTVADAGVNLARGAADVAKTSMMERVADTTGGRIAASIKGTGKDIPTFAENLLSKETRLDREAEIEAFVRKET